MTTPMSARSGHGSFSMQHVPVAQPRDSSPASSGTHEEEAQRLLQALAGLTPTNAEVLTELRSSLEGAPVVQRAFIACGGARVVSSLLLSNSALLQKKALKALVVLASPANAAAIVEGGTLSHLFDVAGQFKADSRRKQLSAHVLKALAGCMEDAAANGSSAASGVGMEDRIVLPPWAHPLLTDSQQPAPRVNWQAEIVGALVDGVLMVDGAPRAVHSTAERIILKLMTMSQYTNKVILERGLVEEMVAAINGMSSSVDAVITVATCLAAMHPSNEVTFVRCGGLEALAQAALNDTAGTVGGGSAAWALLHFVSSGPELAARAAQLGTVEALAQMLYADAPAPRYGAVLALEQMMLQEDEAAASGAKGAALVSSGALAIRQRLVAANGIPALMAALQDVQYRQQGSGTALAVLRLLVALADFPEYRREILDAGGRDMATDLSSNHQDAAVRALAGRLQKRLTGRNLRESFLRRLGLRRTGQLSNSPTNRKSSAAAAPAFAAPDTWVRRDQLQDSVQFDFDLTSGSDKGLPTASSRQLAPPETPQAPTPRLTARVLASVKSALRRRPRGAASENDAQSVQDISMLASPTPRGTNHFYECDDRNFDTRSLNARALDARSLHNSRNFDSRSELGAAAAEAASWRAVMAGPRKAGPRSFVSEGGRGGPGSCVSVASTVSLSAGAMRKLQPIAGAPDEDIFESLRSKYGRSGSNPRGAGAADSWSGPGRSYSGGLPPKHSTAASGQPGSILQRDSYGHSSALRNAAMSSVRNPTAAALRYSHGSLRH